jgi:tetratricopeptide (TPR) repeat protein
MLKGEADEAIGTLRALATEFPEDAGIRQNLGSALLQKGDLEGAVAVYRELVGRHPDALAYYNLGLALKQKDDFAAAEEALRKAMAMDPELPDPPYTLGVVLWQTNRPDEAAEALRAAIGRKPDYAEAHYLLGTILRAKGDLAGASEEFRRTIRDQPGSAEAHLSLGQVLRRLGDAEGAAAATAEAERLNKKKVDVQAAAFAIDLGKRRLAAEDLPGALESLRAAVRLAPEMADAHYQLALALRLQGKGEEAQSHFAKAQRLAPWLLIPPE